MSNKKYDSPKVTEFGSVEEVTHQLNKTGSNKDQFTDDIDDAIGETIVGSTSPAP